MPRIKMPANTGKAVAVETRSSELPPGWGDVRPKNGDLRQRVRLLKIKDLRTALFLVQKRPFYG
jgi:hypothetical protein